MYGYDKTEAFASTMRAIGEKHARRRVPGRQLPEPDHHGLTLDQWTKRQTRIKFAGSPERTERIELWMQKIAASGKDGIDRRDVAEAVGLGVRESLTLGEALNKVGLMGMIGGVVSRWYAAPRLLAYVASGYSMDNDMEQTLSDLASGIQMLNLQVQDNEKMIDRFDPARHKPITLERNTKHLLQREGAMGSLNESFVCVAGCHDLTWREHHKLVAIGHTFEY